MNCFWVDTCINHGRLVYWLCVVMTTVKQKKQVNFAYKRLACGFITLLSVEPNYSQFQNAKYSQNTVKICSTMFNEISENTEFVTALLKKFYILKIFSFTQLWIINLTRDQFTLVHRLTWSCDTEDGSNDAEHLALITGINYILKYIQIESCYFK